MWEEISSREYFQLLERQLTEQELIQHDLTEWLDFVELEWRTVYNTPVLRKTEQDNYDEVESYPSTVRYYKNTKAVINHRLSAKDNKIENLTWRN